VPSSNFQETNVIAYRIHKSRMERDSDYEFSEDLCRVYRELEHTKSTHLDLCDQILNAPSVADHHREWMPASEWTNKLGNKP
jgi:hypothetical protein